MEAEPAIARDLPAANGSGQPPPWLVATVLAFFAVGGLGLGALIHVIPFPAPEGGPSDALEVSRRITFLCTAGMMVFCGVLGGSLYDIRGLIKHSSDDDFDSRYIISYVLRPIAGGLSALIAFFFLIVGALGFSASHTPIQGWTTFEGRLPYLAVAFLAGYSSQVFMLKLKEIADATFSPNDPRERRDGGKRAEAPRKDSPPTR